MPCLWHSSANSFSTSRLNGVASTISKSDSLVSNIEKLSWWRLVIQIYLAPEALMADTHSAALKREG